eukprot:287550-Chlamydomonas_euryale.AAC.1
MTRSSNDMTCDGWKWAVGVVGAVWLADGWMHGQADGRPAGRPDGIVLLPHVNAVAGDVQGRPAAPGARAADLSRPSEAA